MVHYFMCKFRSIRRYQRIDRSKALERTFSEVSGSMLAGIWSPRQAHGPARDFVRLWVLYAIRRPMKRLARWICGECAGLNFKVPRATTESPEVNCRRWIYLNCGHDNRRRRKSGTSCDERKPHNAFPRMVGPQVDGIKFALMGRS